MSADGEPPAIARIVGKRSTACVGASSTPGLIMPFHVIAAGTRKAPSYTRSV